MTFKYFQLPSSEMKGGGKQYGTLEEADTPSVVDLHRLSGGQGGAHDSESKDGGFDVNDEDQKQKRPHKFFFTTAGVLNYLRDMSSETLLVVFLVTSLLVGVALGFGLRTLDPPLNNKQQVLLNFPGEILMNMLKLMILPLIVSSLISGMTSLDTASSGKMVGRAMLYYLSTTFMAVILGIILVVTFRPGAGSRDVSADVGGDIEDVQSDSRQLDTLDRLLDMVRQMFPDNLIEACFSKKVTKAVLVEQRSTGNTTAAEYKRRLVDVDGMNMLGLVVFSLALGVAINKLGEKGRPLKSLVQALADSSLMIVSAVIWFSPIGILFLVAAQIVSLDDVGKSLQQLGYFVGTVLFGLAVHGFGILPLIFFVLVRKNPYTYMRGVLQAMMTALGTASSSATLPVTMRNLQDNLGLDPRVVSFVIPVGATINMDGTALYEAMAAIFIGQISGFNMDIGRVVTICITATAAAIGAAGIPQAGLVTMVIVLESMGFPTDKIAVVLAVDWFLDRIRTMVNVLGDSFGAGIIDHYSRAELTTLDSGDHRADPGPDKSEHTVPGEALTSI